MKHEILRESDYWTCEASKLKLVECPHCREVGGLFKGFSGFGCRKCLCYSGMEDFE